MACDDEEAEGCFGLGYAYELGLGVSKNIDSSKLFYGKACDMGSKDGCKGYKRITR